MVVGSIWILEILKDRLLESFLHLLHCL
jgi:hypothetical protein